jgi:hypothetical protein
MDAGDYMKKPCQHCPFRSDVKPFLHPERAADIAYSAGNPYSEFHCHKTIDYDSRDDGDGVVTNKSLLCAGFVAMQINEAGIDEPDGWVWPDNVYSDSYEMTQSYEDEWNKKRRGRKRA